MSNNLDYKEFADDLEKDLSAELSKTDKVAAIKSLSKNLSRDIGKQIENQATNQSISAEEIAQLYESYDDVVRFTKDLKKKLDNIPESIQEAAIKKIQVNGTTQEIVNGVVNIAVPSLSKAYLIRYQIPANGISDDNTGIISGASTFDLPVDFDSAAFVQDGSILAQYTINTEVTPKTITFNSIPLAGMCFLFYYSV